jgi:AbrB family looped-hinge helix DNA binding protein
MSTATLSSKFQIVIPSEICKALKLVPGEKFQVMSFEGRIEFIVDRPTSALRGFLPGLNTEVVREPDRF